MNQVCYGIAAALLVVCNGTAQAQFNLPVPLPIGPGEVFREDMQMLFHSRLLPDGNYQSRVDSLRVLAVNARSSSATLDSMARSFCAAHTGEAYEQCTAALRPDSILHRFGETAADEQPLHTTLVRSWIPALSTSRPHVAEYLRRSGGGDALDIASKFSANVGEKEAYILSTIVRGLVGRGIFSADQALVVAKSDDPDTATRESIEGAKANALRAVNNGGTLVGRFTFPMYARAGSTAATAIGWTVGAGIMGPVTGDDDERSGAGSTTLEAAMAFPIRALDGTSNVLADLLVAGRVGYTHGGDSLESAGGAREVTYGQLAVGLRQNGSMSVSALVTIANHDFNDLIPRLSVNFAATR